MARITSNVTIWINAAYSKISARSSGIVSDVGVGCVGVVGVASNSNGVVEALSNAGAEPFSVCVTASMMESR